MDIREAFHFGSSIEPHHLAILITVLTVGTIAVWAIVTIFKNGPEGHNFLNSGINIVAITGLFLAATIFILFFWRTL